MNCVSCAAWVKRGAATKVPEKVRLTEQDFSSLIDSMQAAGIGDEDDDSNDDSSDVAELGAKRKRTISKNGQSDDESDSDIEKKYGMDDYDEEGIDKNSRAKLQDIASFPKENEDPYIDEKVADSDEEDMQIMPDDNLLAIGKVKKDLCDLEVFVFNENEDNCWCHHDIILPTFPLAMEWMDFDPGEETKGNFVAIGTMAPDIEIWDLDLIDSLEPAFVLAGEERKKSKKKKARKVVKGHTDSVLDLSWNKIQRNVLASASADYLIGLWDLESGNMVSSVSHHKEKVQTIHWHPYEPQCLVSGSFDKTAKVYDFRSPNDTLKSWKLPGEVERVVWNHHDPFYFLASSDNGFVYCLDARADKPVFTLKAHTDAVAGLVFSPTIPNFVLTASADHEAKVWDIKDNKPVQIYSKDMRIGQLHCAVANPDSGLIFAVGGEQDFRVMNFSKTSAVAKHFSQSISVLDDENDESEVPVFGGNDEGDPEEESAIEKALTDKKKKKKKKDKKKKDTATNDVDDDEDEQ